MTHAVPTPSPATPGPAGTPLAGLDPAAARAHLRHLRQAGGSYRRIAAAAGLDPATVRHLDTGRNNSTRGTAAAILRVTSDAIAPARVDAGGTRLRLRALHVMGHSSERIARAAGVRDLTIRQILRGDARTVSPQLRDKITAVYDAWWDKRAPERTRYQRGAATAARKRAIAGNWCAGAALDEDQLDVPGYRPRYGWKPATGTGTAPEVRPRPRHRRRRPGRRTMTIPGGDQP
jgi:transcriptional regulator with XRE-family HTH domain